MRPVFINSATVTADERLLRKGGKARKWALKVRYGVIRRPDGGVVLIDTGYSTSVFEGPRSLALRFYRWMLKPQLVAEGQIDAALAQLGATTADVKAIIVSHFHADHVAALGRFPNAAIYAKLSVVHAITSRSWWRNMRHGIYPELLPAALAERVIDIDALPQVAAPNGLGQGADFFADGSVLAVDLPGHAEGHFGLCFPQLPRPLLYAVDVQWLSAALEPAHRPVFLAGLIADDRGALEETSRRVAAFRDQGGEVLLCHDPESSPYDLASGATW